MPVRRRSTWERPTVKLVKTLRDRINEGADLRKELNLQLNAARRERDAAFEDAEHTEKELLAHIATHRFSNVVAAFMIFAIIVLVVLWIAK